jgi:hypothetical protein
MLSPKIRNKARMSSLPLLLKTVLEVPSIAIGQEKEKKKRYLNWKGQVKMPVDKMIVYVENLLKSIKKSYKN